MPSFFILLLLLLGSGLFLFGYYNKKPASSVASLKTKTSVKGVTADSGDVEKVIDGDTFTLTTGQRVRLIGINAPEEGQPGYALSKQTLSNMINGKTVDIVYDVTKTDQYGRDLAYIYVGNTFVNEAQVTAGVAVLDTVPPNIMHSADFVKAEAEARQNCRGMWEGLCHQSATSCVQIAGINANPTGSDSAVLNNEWIAIMNTCAIPQNLSGFLLKDESASNSYTFKDVTLQSKHKIKLHSGCGTDSLTDVYWQCPERTRAVWNNTGDNAYLFDNSGKLVSELGY